MERPETTGTGRWMAAARTSEAIGSMFGPSSAAGRLLSVHRSAANVLIDGRLVTVARDSMGGLPNGVAVREFDGVALGLRDGMAARTHDGCLMIDGGLVTIDVRLATVWSPRIRVRPAPDDIPGRAGLVAAAARLLPEVGLRPILGDDEPASNARRVLRRTARPASDAAAWAQPAADGLVRALEVGDLDRATAEGARLVGLGPGLTPSGDDLLVGLTATLTALGDAAARPLAEAWAAVAAGRTTLVAATFHSHAARGQYSERLHHLLDAVLDGPAAGIPRAVGRASEWGASSGVDSVVGVVIAMSRWLA